MPKFMVMAQFQLEDVLETMGIRQGFDPRMADFSGMTGSRDVFIGAVIHKAYADVNEEGTEAAAATAVVNPYSLVISVEETPPVFHADHPFVFLIRDNRSVNV
jgi:serpin B